MRAFSGPVSGAGDFFRLSGGGEARPGISPSFPPFLARRWRPWRRISGRAVPGFHHPRRREALGGGAEAVPLEARMRTKFRTGGFCGFLSKTGAGEVNRRNLREALRKGIGTDRRFAPSEGFRKGSDGMASAISPPATEAFRIAGKSDFADLRFPAGGPFPSPSPRKTPPRPIAAAFGFPRGERGAGRGAPDAPVGDDAERVSASIGKPEVTRQMGARPKAREGFFPVGRGRKLPQGKGEGWTVPFASPGAALRCPVVFLQAPFRPVRRACLFDLHPGRISGRRRLYGAHRPFGPAGWTGESPQGPVRDGERKLRSAPGRVR